MISGGTAGSGYSANNMLYSPVPNVSHRKRLGTDEASQVYRIIIGSKDWGYPKVSGLL